MSDRQTGRAAEVTLPSLLISTTMSPARAASNIYRLRCSIRKSTASLLAHQYKTPTPAQALLDKQRATSVVAHTSSHQLSKWFRKDQLQQRCLDLCWCLPLRAVPQPTSAAGRQAVQHSTVSSKGLIRTILQLLDQPSGLACSSWLHQCLGDIEAVTTTTQHQPCSARRFKQTCMYHSIDSDLGQ